MKESELRKLKNENQLQVSLARKPVPPASEDTATVRWPGDNLPRSAHEPHAWVCSATINFSLGKASFLALQERLASVLVTKDARLPSVCLSVQVDSLQKGLLSPCAQVGDVCLSSSIAEKKM